MASKTELISFLDMPENVHELLQAKNYLHAFCHKDTFVAGIIYEIHYNPDFPQWKNIRHNDNDEPEIYDNGKWHKVPNDIVLTIFKAVYFKCFLHMIKDKKNLFGYSQEMIDEARKNFGITEENTHDIADAIKFIETNESINLGKSIRQLKAIVRKKK